MWEDVLYVREVEFRVLEVFVRVVEGYLGSFG